jgi:hypothetical protein
MKKLRNKSSEIDDESLIRFISNHKERYVRFRDLQAEFSKDSRGKDSLLARRLKQLVKRKSIYKLEYDDFHESIPGVDHKNATIYCAKQKGDIIKKLNYIIKGIKSRNSIRNEVCLNMLVREYDLFGLIPNITSELATIMRRNNGECSKPLIDVLRLQLTKSNYEPMDLTINTLLLKDYRKRRSVLSDYERAKRINILCWLWEPETFNLLKEEFKPNKKLVSKKGIFPKHSDVIEKVFVKYVPLPNRIKHLGTEDEVVIDNFMLGGILEEIPKQVINFEVYLSTQKPLLAKWFNEMAKELAKNWHTNKDKLHNDVKKRIGLVMSS